MPAPLITLAFCLVQDATAEAGEFGLSGYSVRETAGRDAQACATVGYWGASAMPACVILGTIEKTPRAL